LPGIGWTTKPLYHTYAKDTKILRAGNSSVENEYCFFESDMIQCSQAKRENDVA
jgi:hypothetical protein